ncbi:MAG: hypothetical protein HQL56_01285 [Magnetococcales bacterium]|nr:hypothetical protein [Magnetococcales bacterium]
MIEDLRQEIRNQLTRPRSMKTSAISKMAGYLNLDNPLDGFTTQCLARLEDYEIEFMFAGMFTPAISDREACERFMPLEGILVEFRLDLLHQMVRERIFCPVYLGRETARLVIPEVVLARYLRLLNLEAPVTPEINELILAVVPPGGHQRARCTARRRAWRDVKSKAILEGCLRIMGEKHSFSHEKLDFLSDFMRTYRPEHLKNLVGQLHHLVESYHEEPEHPVFNQELEDYQAANIRAKSCGEAMRNYRVSNAQSLLKDLEDCV